MQSDPNFTAIDIPFPQVGELQLKLQLGACQLHVKPGEGQSWVTGIYEDRGGSLPAKISQENGEAKITQDLKYSDWWGRYQERPPRFDLAFGKDRPYGLILDLGASENQLDLGGVPLTRLQMHYGAGKVVFDFSAPNPQAMSLLKIDAGAAEIKIKHLANANFDEMVVQGGAANFDLDFSGELQRNARVKITAGAAAVVIKAPVDTAVVLHAETVLGSLDLVDGFTRKEGAFWNQAALAGKTPRLEVNASVSLGSLKVWQS